MNNQIITEIPPLSGKDCFYVVERYKKEFTYPIHRHEEYELNFIQHGSGVRRIVGDSIEEIGEYDLVLIGKENLEHVWEQGSCRSERVREITIQFAPDLFFGSFLDKNQFASIKQMLEKAQKGLWFPMTAIMKVYDLIDSLSSTESGFYRVLHFLTILYKLSLCEGTRTLSSSAFASASLGADSRRIQKVEEYISHNYTTEIRLSTIADYIGMTPVSFSRFFKLRTGKTLSDYIIDCRLGHASRLLVDTTQTIAEICYDCGFNNISNFNRLFKKKKSISPKDFRSNYQKYKILV